VSQADLGGLQRHLHKQVGPPPPIQSQAAEMQRRSAPATAHTLNAALLVQYAVVRRFASCHEQNAVVQVQELVRFFFMLGEDRWSVSVLKEYEVSLRLRYMPSVQLPSKATEAFAARRCVCVLTLRGAAAGACGDLPQLLLPQPLESVSFQDSEGVPEKISVQHSFLIMWRD